jgi:hypothetical protein
VLRTHVLPVITFKLDNIQHILHDYVSTEGPQIRSFGISFLYTLFVQETRKERILLLLMKLNFV